MAIISQVVDQKMDPTKVLLVQSWIDNNPNPVAIEIAEEEIVPDLDVIMVVTMHPTVVEHLVRVVRIMQGMETIR